MANLLGAASPPTRYALHGRRLPPCPHGKAFSKCSPEEVADLEALFELCAAAPTATPAPLTTAQSFDVDGSGKIDAAELMASYAKIPVHITLEEAESQIAQVDLSRGRGRDGELDMNEFAMGLMQARSKLYHTLYGETERGDGNPFALAGRALPPLPEARAPDDLSEEEAASMQLLFALFDVNGDGEITRHELAIAYSFIGDVDLQAEEVQAHFDEVTGGARHATFAQFAAAVLSRETQLFRVLYGADFAERVDVDDPVPPVPERPAGLEQGPFLVERPEDGFPAPRLTVAVLQADDLKNGSKLHLGVNAYVTVQLLGDGGGEAAERRTPHVKGSSPRWTADNEWTWELAQPLREGDDLVLHVMDHSKVKRDALLGEARLHAGDLAGYRRARASRDVTMRMLAAREPCEADVRIELFYEDAELDWMEREARAREERRHQGPLARLRGAGRAVEASAGAGKAGKKGDCVVS